MALIPKYPLDTAAKLALIREAGWYYDTKKKLLRDPTGQPIWFLFAYDETRPLNSAFHWVIKHQHRQERDWEAWGEAHRKSLAQCMQQTKEILAAGMLKVWQYDWPDAYSAAYAAAQVGLD